MYDKSPNVITSTFFSFHIFEQKQTFIIQHFKCNLMGCKWSQNLIFNNKYVREKGNFTDYPRYSLNLNSLDTSFSFMLIDIVRRN